MDTATTDRPIDPSDPTIPSTGAPAGPGAGADDDAEAGTAPSGSAPSGSAPSGTAPSETEDLETDTPGDGPPPGPPPPPGWPPGPPPGSPPGPPPAGGWDAPAPPPAADHLRRALRRDVRHRVLGGVAAGLADYLDIDVVLVRIGFVVLAILGGSGVLIYLAGWLLIPAADTGRAAYHDFIEARPRRRSLLAVVIGSVIAIIALTNLFSSGPWWPHWDGGFGGFGFFFGLCAFALAVVLLVTSGHRDGSPLRWLALTATITLLGVIAVAAATVFSVEALSGVPLRGGIGDVQWNPTTPAQVAPHYRLAMGTMHVDLRDVTFRPGTTHVTATVGIGQLVVELPPGPAVSVTAHAGMGNVELFGQNDGGIGTRRNVELGGGATGIGAPVAVVPSPGEPNPSAASPATTPSTASPAPPAARAAPARIVLDAETGVGQVQVIRAAP